MYLGENDKAKLNFKILCTDNGEIITFTPLGETICENKNVDIQLHAEFTSFVFADPSTYSTEEAVIQSKTIL